MRVLSSCWPFVRLVAGILYPCNEGAKAPAAPLRWCLHLLFWGSLLTGAWYLHRLAGLERTLRSPWPILHRTWLPLVGLGLYLLGWLGVGLWQALRRDPPVSAWPDFDAAWSDLHASLAETKVPLDEAPLFLLLGPLTTDLRALLKSLGAASIPLRASAPLQVFTHPDGTFVACNKVSHLGLQAPAAGASQWTDSYSEETASRLRHLCQRLAGVRAGTWPVQGIVLVVPFGAMQADDDLRSLIRAAQNDLREVRHATGLDAPLFVAVSGIDLPAGRAWLQRFPPTPDLDPAEVRAMLQDGIDNLCVDQIAGDLRGQLRIDLEPTEDGKPGAGLRANIRLFQSLAAVHAWRARLGQVLIEATENEFSEPGMVAGCHILSEGDAHAAALGLLGNLLVHQQTATWTAESIAAHAGRRRRALAGYGLGLLGTCAGLAWIGWFLWPLMSAK